MLMQTCTQTAGCSVLLLKHSDIDILPNVCMSKTCYCPGKQTEIPMLICFVSKLNVNTHSSEVRERKCFFKPLICLP